MKLSLTKPPSVGVSVGALVLVRVGVGVGVDVLVRVCVIVGVGVTVRHNPTPPTQAPLGTKVQPGWHVVVPGVVTGPQAGFGH